MRKLLTMLTLSLLTLCFFVPSAFAKVTIRLSGQYALEHTTTKLMQEFKEIVEKESNGEIKVRLYPANQLGDYTQVYEELRRGTIEMAVITTPSQFDQRLEVGYMHYVSTDYDDAQKSYAPGSNIFTLTEELNDKLGVKFLAFNVEGFGGLGLTKEPANIFDPTKPKKILLRVPPMEVFQTPCDDAGFQTVSIPFAELYTALQTGVADGWSGGPAMVNYIQYRDVIKYYVANNNYFENTSYLMSNKTWNKLTPAQQEIVQKAALQISQKSFELAKANEDFYLEKMREAGIKVIVFNKEQLQTWADHCRNVTWPKLEKRLTKEVIDSLRKTS